MSSVLVDSNVILDIVTEELDQVLPPDSFRRDPLPWEAAFLAGKCFLRYTAARVVPAARPCPTSTSVPMRSSKD